MLYLTQTAIALISGLLMTRIFKACKLNFPDVTAFLIAGLLIGPYFIGRIPVPGIGFKTLEEVESLELINNVALGFIAFSIGNEFRISQLKSIGKQAVIIGIFQAVVASVLVDISLVLLSLATGGTLISVPAAITLGAIASATAPAATLMVVRQYKAKGKLTDLLLPIVALDDAVGLMVFAVSFGIAQAMKSGQISMISIIVEPIIEIIASLILGAVLGYVLTLLEKLFYSNSNRLALAIGFVILTIALASFEFEVGAVSVHFSSLLVCMMLGTTLCNCCERSADIMTRSDKWTVPLYALFFILSGAELELGLFKNVAIIGIGVLYIIARSCGKYLGAFVSSKATGVDPVTSKYLGITLLPQAGVALGMCVTAAALGGDDAVIIRNVVLFGVMIYELVGPQLTRMALEAAGEIAPKEKEKTTHDRFEKGPKFKGQKA